MIYRGTGSVEGGTGWYLVVLGQQEAVLVDTWWYWVNMQWYWLIYDGAVSVQGGTGWYLVVLGQYSLMYQYTAWYLVKLGQYKAFMPVYI